MTYQVWVGNQLVLELHVFRDDEVSRVTATKVVADAVSAAVSKLASRHGAPVETRTVCVDDRAAAASEKKRAVTSRERAAAARSALVHLETVPIERPARPSEWARRRDPEAALYRAVLELEWYARAVLG